MLKTRVITALIGFIIAVGAITAGGIIYDAAIILLTLLGWREFVLLAKARHVRVSFLWGYGVILAVMTVLSLDFYLLTAALSGLGIFLLYMICTFSHNRYTMHGISYSIFGMVYIVTGMSSLLLLRHNGVFNNLHMPFELPDWGVLILWLVLFSTWASDTFAYFSGRLWGKRKIVPSISPNKTLEGFIGGFIGCVVTGVTVAYIEGIPLSLGLHVGIITGILAPLGDLFESKLKRMCGVKDSGVLLPGHGGVLDRFDSLLFTAPAILLYACLL